MGKIKRDYQRMQAELRAAIARQQQESPYEVDLRNERAQNKAFLDSKDYRNVPGGIDMMPLSELRRFQSYGQKGGTKGLGGENSIAVEQSRDLDNNLLTREWGQAYEGKVAGLRDRNDRLTAGLQGLYSDRMSSGVSGAQSMLQSQAQLKQLYPGFNWANFAAGLVGTGASALTGGLAGGGSRGGGMAPRAGGHG